MAVPSNVTERIDRLEIALKHIEQRKCGDRAEVSRREAVTADRKLRRQPLLRCALAVFAWRDAFVKSRDGQRLWSLIGSGTRIVVFADWFWEGLPIRADNPIGAHTRVFLDGPNHHFLFEEWRNSADGGLEPYQELCRLKSPLEMLEHPQVHPLMIERLQTHLAGPEAWQTILDELDRRLARYVKP